MGSERPIGHGDLPPAVEVDQSSLIKTKRHLFGLKRRRDRVVAGVVVASLATTGAGFVLPREVNRIGTFFASTFFPEHESKNITPDIDPHLVENQKAIKAHEDMLNKFHVTVLGGGDKELMLFGSTNKLAYATCWPYGRALDATYTMTLIPSIGDKYQGDYQKMLATLNEYWNDTPNADKILPGYDPGPKDQRYKDERLTDDGEWVALSLMTEFKNTGNQQALEKAKAVFKFVTSQWDYNDDGGIFWKAQFSSEENHDRGIVSNAPAIMLGVELYQATGDTEYLNWSEKIYDWVNTHLRDEDGLYFDNVHVDKKDNKVVIDTGKATYTQGAMIGALTMLSEAKPEKYPLQNAVDLANATFSHFQTRGHDPIHQNEHENSFNGIYFQNLMYLAGRYNNQSFTNNVQELLQAYINDIDFSKDLDLANFAGAVQLLALQRVPFESYRLLF